MTKKNREIRLLTRKGEPEVPTIDQEGAIFLKVIAGSPELFLKTNEGTIRLTNNGVVNTGLPGAISGTGTDNRIVRWDGTSDVQDSDVTIDDSGNFTDVGNLTFQDNLSATIGYISRSDTTNGNSLTISSQGNTNGVSGNAGNINIQPANSTSGIGGQVFIRPGTGNINGLITLRDHAGTNRVLVNSNRNLFLSGLTAVQLEVDTGEDTLFSATGMQFNTSFSAPIISQADDSSGTAGSTLTLRSQSISTVTGSATTGGDVAIVAGNASGTGAGDRTGGNISITAGDGINASGTLTGGNVTIKPGTGATTGELFIQDGAGNNRFQLDSIFVRMNDASGNFRIRVDNVGNVLLNGANNFLNTDNLQWVFNLTTPTLSQADQTSTSGTVNGSELLIRAQNTTGAATTNNAGDVRIRGGDATNATTNNGGDVVIEMGAGATANGEFRVETASNVSQFRVDTTAVRVETDSLTINENQSSPTWVQTADANDNATADDWTLRAQSVTGGGTTITAGDLILAGGDSNGGSATTRVAGNVQIITGTSNAAANDGNISLITNASNYQSMSRGIFVADSSAVPTGNPSSGGFLYSESGALKWRGSSGTVTTMGTAHPHCPTCGRDSAVEWKNEDEKWELALCMWCITDALGNIGIITKEQK